ncbi:uncharacterized protein LOC135814570 [Sycon ciliatum]|uniref:uncharacterized protein LOC135814570 n=1 Tax=Sycon ciliatum TaxID=27933 RepID=UPI0031F691F1
MKATKRKKRLPISRRRKFRSVAGSEDESDTDYTPAQVEKAKTRTGKDSANDYAAQRICRLRRSTVEWCELPVELWVKIFSDVVELAGGCVPVLLLLRRVCRLWSEICLTPSLWRTVTFSRHAQNGPRCVPQAAIPWLTNNALHYARHLDLTGFSVNKTGIGSLVERCKELVGLTVPTSDMYLACPVLLSQLTIHQCKLQHFYQLTLRRDLLQNLTKLSLGKSSAQDLLLYIDVDMPLLEFLSLDGFIVYWVVIVERCGNLRHLTLVRCKLKHLLHDLPGLPKLQSCTLVEAEHNSVLDWRDWRERTAWEEWMRGETHVIHWLERCAGLEHLTLSGDEVMWVYINALRERVICLQSLRYLGLYGVLPCISIEPFLTALVQHSSSSLESIEITNLVVGDSLAAGEFSCLRHLQLHHSYLTAPMCLKLLEACTQLKSVSLSGNYQLPRGTKQAFSADRFGRLKELLKADTELGDAA